MASTSPFPSTSAQVTDRTPILIGVGTAHRKGPGGNRRGGSGDAIEPVDLMVEAALAALSDAGSGAVAGRLGMVAVPVGNWEYADPGRLVAERIGATGARTVRVEIGVPQHTPVRVAFERIASGQIEAALVVGGEAKATQSRLTRAGTTPPETDQGDLEPDERWSPQGEFMAQAEIDAGIWSPVEQYACIENALGHAEGLDHDQHLDQIATLWHGLNGIAGENPLAAFGEPRTFEFLRSPGPGNRPLAHPYAKWHSTQWAVDQAGAMVLCSVGTARTLGVPPQRWVFPRVLVESSFSLSLTRRAQMHRWPAMAVLGNAASKHLERPLGDVEHTELYSCFPSAVRVCQRELGLDPTGVPSVMGGMAFAGGPFNNFTYQSTAAVVDRVRRDPGSLGMVTTVSGLLTKPALAVWSTDPGPGVPLVADLATDAAAATGSVDVTADHHGEAAVASYTVTHTGDEPTSAFVIADLAEGGRWIGSSTDPELLAVGLASELIGRTVAIDGGTCAVR